MEDADILFRKEYVSKSIILTTPLHKNVHTPFFRAE